MNMTLDVECDKCGGKGYLLQVKDDGYRVARECECMARRRVLRFLRQSGVNMEEYEQKTLERFLTDDVEAAEMRALATRFLADAKAKGIGFFGRSGTGKTHICIAICLELTNIKLEPHHYFAYRREIQKIKAVFYNHDEYNRLMDKWCQCQNLYIDDLFKFAVDKAGVMQAQDLQIMFDIVNTRYLNGMRTLFTSEYSLNDIRKVDEAFASRIYDMCHPYLMRCSGQNRRFQKGEP